MGSKKKVLKDKYEVLFTAPSTDDLRLFIKQGTIDICHGHLQHQQNKKGVTFEAYLNEDDIARLKKNGWEYKVGENFSKTGRERWKQIGKGDRFEGGTIKPRGVGKTREANSKQNGE